MVTKMTTAIAKPKLAILVSKQCDMIIGRGVDDRFIHQCYDHVEEAVESRVWTAMRSNSITMTAAFGLTTYPPRDMYDPDLLEEKFLTPCTNVLAFWGGGPKFVNTLRLALDMGKRVRIYRCDLKTHRVVLIPNSAIAESSW